jgi:hypothetical protein
LIGELESSDGDDLSIDTLAVDEDSFIVENVKDGGDFALLGTVDDPNNAADLNESMITLNSSSRTIFDVW